MSTTAAVVTALAIVVFTTGILLLLPKMARPTLPFGVRVPDEHAASPAIGNATAQYYRGLLLTMLVAAAALVVLALILPGAVVSTIAVFVVLGAWLVPYLSARRLVQTAKRTEGWYADVRQSMAADTSLRTTPPPYPWGWAIPAIAIALITIAVGIAVYPSLPDRIILHIGPDGPDQYADTTLFSAFGIVGVQVLLTALLLGLTALALRSKADISAAQPEVSADQYRRYATIMAKSLLALSACTNLTMLAVALVIWDVAPPSGAWLTLTFAPIVIGTVALIVVSIRTGQSGHRLSPKAAPVPAGKVDRDDDRFWIGGLLYRNADDGSLLVPKRYGGTGWTINLAHPAAWLIVGLTLAVAIGAPIIAAVAA